MMISNVNVTNPGRFTCTQGKHSSSGNFPLTIIRMAWDAGCSFEAEADGFGIGRGTCGGDWSGIRDSSAQATDVMLAKALNFIQSKLTK